MPPTNKVETLLNITFGKFPKIMTVWILNASSNLVKRWIGNKMKKTKKPAIRQPKEKVKTVREQVLLTSGRRKEGEEEAFTGDQANVDLDYEHKEQWDQYDAVHARLDSDLLGSVAHAVKIIKEYLIEGCVTGLVDKLASCYIQAIESAVIERNGDMHKQDRAEGLNRINTEMCIILSLVDAFTARNVHRLDLTEILQGVRNRIYIHLDGLHGLRCLELGEASHGYIPELFKQHFMSGLSNMSHLVHFSLHCDCFDELLDCLSANSGRTIRILDVQGSMLVTDKSVGTIASMKGIFTLNIFSCGLSDEGQAELLLQLPDLVNLVRGDFLCDALEWISWWEKEKTIQKNKQLKIREFYSSESYHFHTKPQMVAVAKYCPLIHKMRFMFSKEHMLDFLPLAEFHSLRELNICGGDFYADGLIDLLEKIGNQLTTLELYYVDQLDMKALAMMTVYCKNVIKLGFSNCGFRNTVHELSGLNNYQDPRDEYERYLMSREMPVTELIQPLQSLRTLHISSSCSAEYPVLFLSRAATRIQHLQLGSSVAITDSDILKVVDKLQHLETFVIRGSEREDLTIQSVELLLASCSKLKQLTDLTSWAGIFPRELQLLHATARENNWDLDLGEDTTSITEEALRRAGLKEKFDRLREQFGDMVMIP